MCRYLTIVLFLFCGSSTVEAQVLALQNKSGRSISYYYPGDQLIYASSKKQAFSTFFIDSIGPKLVLGARDTLLLDSIRFIRKERKGLNYVASGASLMTAGILLPLLILGNNAANGNRPLLHKGAAYTSIGFLGLGGSLILLRKKTYTIQEGKYRLVVIEKP